MLICFFCVNFLGTTLYRHYIYSQNLYDYHLADVMGNIFGVVCVTFLFILLSRESRWVHQVKIAFVVCVGLITYELLQKILPWQTFDYLDIYGSLVGLSLSILIISVFVIISPSREIVVDAKERH